MKIYDAPLSDLESIAREIGVTFEGTDESNSRGSRVRGRLIPDRSKPTGSRPYQRVSASIAFHEGRKVFAVCWHGHRDFMARVFTRYPDARIQTAFADYRGIVDFDDKYLDTAHRNIGSLMFPVSAWSACDCCENYSYGPMLEISDSEYLNAVSHARYRADGISEARAREIASHWHGGQWTPLYAFSSSGIIEDHSALIADIDACFPHVRYDESAKADLNALRAYVCVSQAFADDKNERGSCV